MARKHLSKEELVKALHAGLSESYPSLTRERTEETLIRVLRGDTQLDIIGMFIKSDLDKHESIKNAAREMYKEVLV